MKRRSYYGTETTVCQLDMYLKTHCLAIRMN